jgi:hypothetical protein
MTRPSNSLLLGVDVVCLGILLADVIAWPIDALPETGTLALVDSITSAAAAARSTPHDKEGFADSTCAYRLVSKRGHSMQLVAAPSPLDLQACSRQFRVLQFVWPDF